MDRTYIYQTKITQINYITCNDLGFYIILDNYPEMKTQNWIIFYVQDIF